jgi:transcriptional regulator with XRE-family HTH domain
MLVSSIQKFLTTKLKENNYSRNELANKCNISYAVLHNLLKATRPNPSPETLCKIADSFNISIDEIVGRVHSSSNSNIYNKQSVDQSMVNLKTYINHYLETNNVTPIKLAQSMGIGDGAITEFIQDNNRKKSLGTAIIVKLANHLDVSIDEMIGRTSSSKEKIVKQSKSESIVGITNPDDLATLKKIKTSIALKTQSLQKSKQEPLEPSKNNKSMSHIQRLMQERANKNNNREL